WAAETPGRNGRVKSSGPVFFWLAGAARLVADCWAEERTMRKKVSDWEELEDLTNRLDELRSQLDAAENGNKFAMIYALEEAVAEAELARTQVLSRLSDRLAEETAA